MMEDHMSSNGQSSHIIEISRDILKNTTDANWGYKEALLEQRKENEDGQKVWKRKTVDNEIKTVKTKQRS